MPAQVRAASLRSVVYQTHPRQTDDFGDLLTPSLKISAGDLVPCRNGERSDSPCLRDKSPTADSEPTVAFCSANPL